MKKLMKAAAIILSSALVFTMAACGKKEDPKVVFDQAVKKNAELTSLDMDTSTNITFKQGTEAINITTDMNMKISHLNEANMQYLATTSSSVMGQSVDAVIFYKDGYYYIDGMGQKIKYPMDLNKLIESVKASMDSTNLKSAQMKEITMEEESDQTILSFTADPEQMNSYIDDIMESMQGMEGMASDLFHTEMVFKEASGTYTIGEDGYYTDMTMRMDVDMAVQDKTVSMVIELAGKVNQPGQEVTVELPDTEGFTEVENLGV